METLPTEPQAEPKVRRRRGPNKNKTATTKASVADRLTMLPTPKLRAELDALQFIHATSFRGLIELAVESMKKDLPTAQRTMFDEMVKLRLGK